MSPGQNASPGRASSPPLFDFNPPDDAIAITGGDGARQIQGKVIAQLVDRQGRVTGDGAEATTALTKAFRFKQNQVRNVKKYFELHGATKSGGKAPKFESSAKGRVKISWEGASAEVADVIMDLQGKVITENGGVDPWGRSIRRWSGPSAPSFTVSVQMNRDG